MAAWGAKCVSVLGQKSKICLKWLILAIFFGGGEVCVGECPNDPLMPPLHFCNIHFKKRTILIFTIQTYNIKALINKQEWGFYELFLTNFLETPSRYSTSRNEFKILLWLQISYLAIYLFIYLFTYLFIYLFILIFFFIYLFFTRPWDQNANLTSPIRFINQSSSLLVIMVICHSFPL